MLNRKATPTNPKLDQIISDLEDFIATASPDDDGYSQMVSNLESLYKLRNGNVKESQTQLKDWMPLISSLAGILTIVTFEAFGNTVTSKALSFVGKSKA